MCAQLIADSRLELPCLPCSTGKHCTGDMHIVSVAVGVVHSRLMAEFELAGC